MQYMLLIYNGNTTDEPTPGTPEFDKYMEGYGAFTNEVKEKGVMVDGNPLQSVTTATTVRVRNGAPETIDGPFAETKETLGGYYLLDCKDIDEAIEYAAKIPTARYGSVEIRPIMVFDS